MGRSAEPSPVAVEFGRRVRARRQELGWSIERLADESGLSPSWIARIELKGPDLSVVNMCRVAAALGVEVGQLGSGLELLV